MEKRKNTSLDDKSPPAKRLLVDLTDENDAGATGSNSAQDIIEIDTGDNSEYSTSSESDEVQGDGNMSKEELEIESKIKSLFSLACFDKTLVENVRKALDALEGAWFKVYKGKSRNKQHMQKVQRLIREGVEYLNSSLSTLSRITVTVAVFGPLGVGKSYLLNHLLKFNTEEFVSSSAFPNLLPSGEGDSQTPIPVRIKFAERVQIILKREANNISQLRKSDLEQVRFGPKEMSKDSLESAGEIVRTIFNDKESLASVEWLELKGPFPVFKKLTSIIAEHSNHPDVHVDVELVDLPGSGDQTGNPLIGKELNRANIIMLFQAGRSSRPITAEDIAGVFRRRQAFEYPSRPKLIHLVNEQKPSHLDYSPTIQERLLKKRQELDSFWKPLLEGDNLEECYKVVQKRFPQLMGRKCLEKMKEESEVVIFENEGDVFLTQLGEAIARHMADVQIKKEVHPVVDKMFRVTKRLRTRTTTLITTKKNSTRKRNGGQQEMTQYELKVPSLRILESEENEEEEIRLCRIGIGNSDNKLEGEENEDDADDSIHSLDQVNEKLRDVSKISDTKQVHSQLCDYLFLQDEVLSYLLKVLLEALDDYCNTLLEEAASILHVSTQGYTEIADMLCRKRVETFMKTEAGSYIIAVIKKIKGKNLLGDCTRKKEWKNANEEARLDLIPSYLKLLLEGVVVGFTRPMRNAPLLKLEKTLHDDVQALVRCNPYSAATSTEDLSLIVKKLELIIAFCREKIREINPHPSLEGISLDHTFPFPTPKTQENHAATEFKKVKPEQLIEKMSKIILKKSKGDCLRELEKALKLSKGALGGNLSSDISDLSMWAKVLLNVLLQDEFLGKCSDASKPIPSELQVQRGDPEIEKLFNHARRRLFAYERSRASCELVQDESVNVDEIRLKLTTGTGKDTALQAVVSSKLRHELDEMANSFTEPKEQLASIFIPTIHTGPEQNELGNFYLEENPWSEDGSKKNEENSQESFQDVQIADGGLGKLKANIFVVIEPKHVEVCKTTMANRPPPRNSNVTLRYVVLPQNGRGIGVSRSIIKLLAECLKLPIYWTIDDDIKYLYQFDMNDRSWKKCSFGRALLFGQHVFQQCVANAVNDLDDDSRDDMAEECVEDKFPKWAKKTRRKAKKILIDSDRFKEVKQNPGLLHSPFSEENVRADCSDDKDKAKQLRSVEKIFVEDCKSRLHNNAFKNVAGVSIAHLKCRRSDYVSKLATMHYRRSEQRYQMVLNNTDALKGYNFVQDDIVLNEDEQDTVSDSSKRNTPYWGCRREDKSFSNALACYGVSGYQIICFDHEEEKLRNVFDRVGESWQLSQEPWLEEYEEEAGTSNE